MDQLAGDSEWNIIRHQTSGQWVTAEWQAERRGALWRIGLTPVRPGIVAAMLWSGDRLVDHARGAQPAMWAMVCSWVNELDHDDEPRPAASPMVTGPHAR
ncbi:hypothetical protein AB0K15_13180 [Amycolatopsis sp. NPDC049253]|uniref:hypothetical protein n=1 Tax=Amycolatopsis sp. NPDC049253 TaxID=3155274 RepID=UPI00342B2322